MGAGPVRACGSGIDINTRGRTRVVIDGTIVALRPRERAVVAAIAATHPRPADVSDIISRVWGDAAPQHARNSLHNHIGRIRRAAPDLIDSVDGGYVLDARAIVDHVAGDLHDIPLGDLVDTDEVTALRSAIDEAFDFQVEQRLRQSIASPSPDSVALARRLVDTHPEREHLWQLLAATQAGLGQRRDALSSIRAARRALAEFGLELGDELKAFESDLLGGTSSAPPTPDLPTPARVHPHTDDPFVGRDVELTDLAVAWRHAVDSGSPQMAIIRGPAGIGKTRLVDEFTRRATAGDGPDATISPRLIVSRERLDDDRPLGALSDVLATDTPTTVTGNPSDTDIGRDLQHRVDRAVEAIAREATIWCLDDLQWMPTDSLRLITHAIERATGPLLVIATHRSGELSTPGLLDRRVATTSIDLQPMERDDLEALVSAWDVPFGSVSDLDLLHLRTAGHPMFASEVARVANRRGEQIDVSAIPTALADWVRNRLEELSDPTIDVLQIAAAVGAQFHVDIVAASAAHDDDTIDEILDGLVTRGVVASSDRVGLLQFSHEIVRDVVYQMLGPARARRRHAAIAAALAERPDVLRPAEWHASSAFHLLRAGGDPVEVRTHAVAASDAQLANGAWTAAHHSISLALDTDPPDAERAELLSRRGRAELRLQRFADATDSLNAAIDIASRLGLVELRGRAVLDLVGRAGRGAAVEASDDERIDAVRGALEALGDDTDDTDLITEIRSELERELAFAMLLTGESAERDRLLAASVDRIERQQPPNPQSLAVALLGRRYAQLAPDQLDLRLADIERVLSQDRDRVSPETVAAAHTYRIEETLRAGRIAAARQSLVDAEQVLESHPQPYLRWALAGWRVMLAVIDGDLERAEVLASRAMALGGESGEALAGFGVNLTNIRLLQGRADEMIDLLAAAVADHPEIPAYRAVLALCAAEAGQHDLAASSIDWFAEQSFANLPDDTNRSLALAALAHGTAEIGHLRAAPLLTPLVEPYAGQHIVISTYGGGGAYWGPARYALARLARTVGDELSAHRWFGEARREAAHAPLLLERIRRHADAAERDSIA